MAKDRDFFVNARKIVELAIGEKMDGTALENPNAGKDPKAISRGRTGGKKGGQSRAAKLSAERRSEIAHKAAIARWKKA